MSERGRAGEVAVSRASRLASGQASAGERAAPSRSPARAGARRSRSGASTPLGLSAGAVALQALATSVAMPVAGNGGGGSSGAEPILEDDTSSGLTVTHARTTLHLTVAQLEFLKTILEVVRRREEVVSPSWPCDSVRFLKAGDLIVRPAIPERSHSALALLSPRSVFAAQDWIVGCFILRQPESSLAKLVATISATNEWEDTHDRLIMKILDAEQLALRIEWTNPEKKVRKVPAHCTGRISKCARALGRVHDGACTSGTDSSALVALPPSGRTRGLASPRTSSSSSSQSPSGRSSPPPLASMPTRLMARCCPRGRRRAWMSAPTTRARPRVRPRRRP